ncbi:MAG: hypothetical protein AB7T63_06085 [Planctomycetota bacterium]
MKKLLKLDWDVIAGIAAAGLAIILHLLHVVHSEVLLTIALVLLAILLFRDLRREGHGEQMASALNSLGAGVQDIRSTLTPPEAILIGPRNLRIETRRFVESARGHMVWFNVCFAMFRRQEVFDLLLRPAIENPLVEAIQFIANEGERDLWDKNMAPKISECAGSGKVIARLWRRLPETVSFILADINSTGKTEALLSFWGEPFMSRAADTQLPRYVFWVHAHANLVAQFVEMERRARTTDA